ncbi:MAG: glycosyltransferase family 1 protein [Planctomycetes bacterium]|nr:glycosyltransferase family 1 protein [Planctomycetota bacterium]
MIRVHFVGAQGKYQSIETQAVRIHGTLERIGGDRASSRLSLLPQDAFRPRGLFRRAPLREMEGLVQDADILVVVKSSLFRDFLKAAGALRRLCEERGARLLSNPCDGPGADTGDTADVFTEEVAHYALALSRAQAEAIARKRPAGEVLLVGHASRLESSNRLVPRDRVRKVVWENAIHRNPRYDARKVGMPRERFQELEDAIRGVLADRGAELVFIDAWRETQSYEEWERTMLDADIAIECKALGGQYVDYQSQKPAVKVLNYMSLGLPVLCDSLPAYRELGEDGKELLFADTIEDWKRQLTRLLDDCGLRFRLGEAAREAAGPHSIEAVVRRYMDCFERIAARPARRLAPA